MGGNGPSYPSDIHDVLTGNNGSPGYQAGTGWDAVTGLGTPNVLNLLTVAAGALDHIVISPPTSSITAGANQVYSVTAYDASNNSLGNVSGSTNFSIQAGAGGSWSGATYTSAVAGTWTVTGSYSGKSATATLTVTAASGQNTLTLRPSGAAYTSLTVVGATNNWQAESDGSDSTYVTGVAGYGYFDLYLQPGHTTETGTITNVQIYVRGNVVHVDGSGNFSARSYSPSTGYIYGTTHTDTAITTYSDSYTTNPGTGSAWTWAQIDSLKLGCAASQGGLDTVNIYDVWMVVTYI